jgi:hypothetical protein
VGDLLLVPSAQHLTYRRLFRGEERGEERDVREDGIERRRRNEEYLNDS